MAADCLANLADIPSEKKPVARKGDGLFDLVQLTSCLQVRQVRQQHRWQQEQQQHRWQPEQLRWQPEQEREQLQEQVQVREQVFRRKQSR